MCFFLIDAIEKLRNEDYKVVTNTIEVIVSANLIQD